MYDNTSIARQASENNAKCIKLPALIIIDGQDIQK